MAILFILISCEDKYYSIDEAFYDGKEIVVKNPLLKGNIIDTLRIELNNTEKIMIEEASDSSLIFDSKAFVYKVQHDSVATVAEDGTISPVSRGTTRLDIVFRSNENLKTSVILKIYKEYHKVEEIFVPASVANSIVEIGEPYDLATMLIVLPVNADNKKLIFSLEENSKQYAEITESGIITGTKATGRNRATVKVTSEDNPEITTTFPVQVVTEIMITAVNLLPGLDGIEIGLGETIDLNLTTSVSPTTVNEKNKKLTFELLEGANVLELNADGVVKAIGLGTARLRATSKNGMTAEFSIVVKEGITDLTRLLWTVKSSLDYGYVPDGTTGLPEHMFDNNTTTFFSVTKPGKTYNDRHTPADHIPYFIVDLKSEQKFNYIRWNHRSNNGNDFLRVWGIDCAGSNDGETFTDIKKDITIPTTSNSTTYHLDIPASQYRYVKVMLTKWSDNSGGSTSGSTMQIGEFGLGFK